MPTLNSAAEEALHAILRIFGEPGLGLGVEGMAGTGIDVELERLAALDLAPGHLLAGRPRDLAVGAGQQHQNRQRHRPAGTVAGPGAVVGIEHRDGAEAVDLYSDEFLIERPLLKALRSPRKSVLLIDEIDRSDHEFEAFLLEFLSDFQVSIPETGTLRAATPPVIVLTSNRTRELHEALRRRCVYHWIAYPSPQQEAEIIMLRAGDVARATAAAVAAAVSEMRALPLAKPPGISEAVEWADAATLLEQGRGRWPEAFRASIGVVIKDEEDMIYLEDQLDELLDKACA